MDAKSRILEAGARIVRKKGFLDTGLVELLEAANVPKGSFYFYFKNKEDFGLQLIDYFDNPLEADKEEINEGGDLPHIEKIRRIFKWQAESFRKHDFKGGCPFGNLALEMGDRNHRFRKKLNRVFEDMKKDLAARLKQAEENEEISDSVDPLEAAQLIICCFEGALMQMKVSKTTLPYEVFDRMVFMRLLKE